MSVYSIIKECMVYPFGIEHPWFNMGIIRPKKAEFLIVLVVDPPIKSFEPMHLVLAKASVETVFHFDTMNSRLHLDTLLGLLQKDKLITTAYLTTPLAKNLSECTNQSALLIGKKRMECWGWDFEKYKKANNPYDDVIRIIEHAVDIVIAPLVLNEKVEKLTQALRYAQIEGGTHARRTNT